MYDFLASTNNVVCVLYGILFIGLEVMESQTVLVDWFPSVV